MPKIKQLIEDLEELNENYLEIDKRIPKRRFPIFETEKEEYMKLGRLLIDFYENKFTFNFPAISKDIPEHESRKIRDYWGSVHLLVFKYMEEDNYLGLTNLITSWTLENPKRDTNNIKSLIEYLKKVEGKTG